jgi:hypothetical protein
MTNTKAAKEWLRKLRQDDELERKRQRRRNYRLGKLSTGGRLGAAPKIEGYPQQEEE